MHRRDHAADGAVRPRRSVPRRAGEVRYSCESLLSHAQSGRTSFGSNRSRANCTRSNFGCVPSRPAVASCAPPYAGSWLYRALAGKRSSIRMRVLRYACVADVPADRASGWQSVVERFLQRLEQCRSAGNSMQLLQDRASVTASFAERKPGSSLISTARPLIGRHYSMVPAPTELPFNRSRMDFESERVGGRYRIRTYDFHRVKMALYR